MSKTFEKYERLIKGRKFSEQELIAFRKYVNGSSPLTPSDAQYLIDSFDEIAASRGVLLTEQQQVKGLLWLKHQTFRLNGAVRKNAPLDHFEREVLKRFKKFTCVGLYNLNENHYRQYVPIYRCHATNGTYFDYACLMWGEIRVLEIGNRSGRLSMCNQPSWSTARQATSLQGGAQ